MQKLEEILQAEEAARHAVGAAKERAAALVAEAEAASRATADEARESAALEAAQIRADALARAAAQAARVESDALSGLDESISVARARIPAAVDAAVAAITE